MNRPIAYPTVDDDLVARLVPLAEELDELASSRVDCTRQRDEFNALAGTCIENPFDFHFSGACRARDFVRDQLARRHIGEFVGLDDADMLVLLRAICAAERIDELPFWLEVLEMNLPDAPLSDLIFYPDIALEALGRSDIKADSLAPEDILRIARSLSARTPIAP